MAEPIVLPPGVAIAILAFLLSLLPAGLFLWLWYLRRHDRPVPTKAVALAFFLGLVIVWPAFLLEKYAANLWDTLSPTTAHYFGGAIAPLFSFSDIILPAIGTFIIVATVEEGLRYGVLSLWFRRSTAVDQVFDGIVLGLTAGLGFATLENTLYFFSLFSTGEFDTLVFVFFLRFLVSTLAHISFGGLMGALLARAYFSSWRPRLLFIQAFAIPWFLHGLYDWLLSVNQVSYAVLVLLPALLTLTAWSSRREFFAIEREQGKALLSQKPPKSARPDVIKERSPWNKNAPWLTGATSSRWSIRSRTSIKTR